MRNIKAPKLKTCRPNSNLVGSFSIKKKDEKDYQDLRQHLYFHHISVGEYLVDAYRELDKLSFSN
tara:strand:- start:2619 stop:2813 length:195 start_codon:yes stop_codon:yes gene_type:complete